MFKESFEGAAEEVVAFELGRLLGLNVPYTEAIRGADGQVQAALMRWVPGACLNAVIEGIDRNCQRDGREVRSPGGSLEAWFGRPEVRDQYIRDRILSAILGDHDRRDMNYMVTPDGRLVAIDHGAAEPFEENLAAVEAKMRDRLANPRSRTLDRRMQVRPEDVEALWGRVGSQLTDGALDRIVANFPPADRARILETWKRRIALLPRVMRDVLAAP